MHDYMRFVCYDEGKAQMKGKSDYLEERNIRISMTLYVLLVDLWYVVMYHSLIKIAVFELKCSLKDMKNIASPPEIGKDYHIRRKCGPSLSSFFLFISSK